MFLSKRVLFLLVLSLICLYSALQFILILRHKSPYVSDSYFYNHIVYEFKGDTYHTSRNKVLSKVEINPIDKITQNIYFNSEQYQDSYGFFSKRPLYPFTVFLLNKLFDLETSMLLPVFVSYLGLILVSFAFLSKRLNLFWASFGTFTFMSFYPFLDWSTYYLTDTIGAFFWMLQIYFIYKLLSTKKNFWLLSFIIISIIALTNREQSLLMPVVSFALWTITKIKKDRLAKHILPVVFASVIISATYLVVSLKYFHKNLISTITYTMNDYGLLNNEFSSREILNYLINSYIKSHVALFNDLLAHHLWAVFALSSIIGVSMALKKIKIIDVIMIASALGSYLAIYLYPVLSYRYFFPLVISICYFATFLFFRLSIYLAKIEE